MTFYWIGWFSSICYLYGWVILHNKKLCLLWCSVDLNLKSPFLIKNGYYIVPSPSTALLITLRSYQICFGQISWVAVVSLRDAMSLQDKSSVRSFLSKKIASENNEIQEKNSQCSSNFFITVTLSENNYWCCTATG